MDSDNRANSVPVVYAVDDEDGMRQALRRLFNDAGFAVETYPSAPQFLAAYAEGRCDGRRGCLVLDLHMPGMSGLELQAALRERGVRLPIVFLTGASRVCDAVAAMKAGADDFLEKPFDPPQLVARVRSLLEPPETAPPLVGSAEVERRRALLTAREQEVMQLMVTGQTSKEIARVLGGSHRTIEIHRARVMQKMEAASLADLVRMTIAGPLVPPAAQ